ncbi:aminopeptidase [Candidatus Woesearchaeota archaeon]|nr:aminopeptidase [Candidatus Woesearchaeota archaeon]
MNVKVQSKFTRTLDINVFKRVFRECLNVGNEKVLIIGDYGKNDRLCAPIITNGYAVAAKELGLNYKVFYQNAKGREDFADPIMLNHLEKLPKNSCVIMNVSNRIGDLGRLGKSYRRYMRVHRHKFTSASSLGDIPTSFYKDVVESINVDYKLLQEQGMRLKKILDNATELHVTTPAGTDLTMDVHGIPAIANTGSYREFGQGGNIPCGEVYLWPRNTNGTLVIDGSYRHKDGTHVTKEPIRMEIRNGKIVKLNSSFEARTLEATFKWAEKRSKHPETVRQIAEFAVGINPKAKIIGATIVDEKTLGTCHMANGSNSWFGGPHKSIVHFDHVFKNPIIKADGRLIMRKDWI